MDMRIDVAGDIAALQAIVPAWDELAANACEINPFYESWILLPALRAQGDAGLRCVLVWQGERLIGLFPFERKRQFKGLPVPVMTSWRHSAHLLCTPLVRADAAAECLEAVFGWAAGEGALLEFRYIPADGGFHGALGDAMRTTPCTVLPTAQFSRALLKRGASAEAYMAASMSSGLRRQLRRKERQLAERSGYSTLAAGPGGDLGDQVERFMVLEASGWKGREGGAFAAKEASLRFGTEVLGEAHRRGRLHMVGIDCEGRPVARRFSILAGEGSYAFKTAYDEAYCAYSPGVLAELVNLREFHQLDGVKWQDAYTEPDNFTVNRMWQDRRVIQSLAVAVGAWGDFWLSSLPLLRWTARRYESLRRVMASARQNLSISR